MDIAVSDIIVFLFLLTLILVSYIVVKLPKDIIVPYSPSVPIIAVGFATSIAFILHRLELFDHIILLVCSITAIALITSISTVLLITSNYSTKIIILSLITIVINTITTFLVMNNYKTTAINTFTFISASLLMFEFLVIPALFKLFNSFKLVWSKVFASQ